MKKRCCFFPGRLWSWLWLLAVISGLWVFSAAAEQHHPRVLIINSYHPGYLWSDNEMTGLLEQLRRRYPDINPAIEYLDTKRFPTAGHLLFMKDYLATKYRGQKFDLVITLDNPALDMVLQHRQELFPGTPLVFAGVNDFQPSMLAGQEKVTGVAEKLEIAGALKTMLALHPETKEVFVIHDYTATGLATRREMEAFLPDFQSRVHIKFAPPAATKEIINHIKSLPAKSLVLILSFATDKTGQTFTPVEITRLFTSGIDIPVYAVHGFRLGHGIVGGILLGGKEQGSRAGVVAIWVLAGEDPAKIPVEIKSTAQPMFDYEELSKFGISLGALPEGSIIINRPESFYQKNRTWVLGTLFTIVTLSLVVVSLTVTIMRRRRAEDALAKNFRELEENIQRLEQSRNMLQLIIESVPVRIFWKDSELRYLGCNTLFARDAGLNHPQQLLGKDDFAMGWGEQAEAYRADDLEVMESRRPRLNIIEPQTTPTGDKIWLNTSKVPLHMPNGEVFGVLGIYEDITERKRVEETLLKYKFIADTANDYMTLINRNYIYEAANAVFCKAHGKTQEEVVGTSLTNMWGEDRFKNYIKGDLDRCFTGQAVESVDWFEFGKLGRGCYRVFYTPYFNEDGTVAYVAVVTHDITAPKRYEKSLRESEEKCERKSNREPLVAVQKGPTWFKK